MQDIAEVLLEAGRGRRRRRGARQLALHPGHLGTVEARTAMLRDLGSLPAIVLFPLFAVVGIGLTLLFDIVMRHFVAPETREAGELDRVGHAAGDRDDLRDPHRVRDRRRVRPDPRHPGRPEREGRRSLRRRRQQSRLFPKPTGSQIRDAALAYARAVVDDGLPQLEDTGRPSRPADVKLEALFQTVQRVGESEEATPGSRTSRPSNALDQVMRSRESLIDSARATIPNSLLGLLFVIGMTVMAVATMLDTQHRRSHLFILSSLALVIWLTLALGGEHGLPVQRAGARHRSTGARVHRVPRPR